MQLCWRSLRSSLTFSPSIDWLPVRRLECASEVLLSAAPRESNRLAGVALMTFASPSKMRSWSVRSFHLIRSQMLARHVSRLPLIGFSKFAPTPFHSLTVHSRLRLRRISVSAPGSHTRHMFHSRRFSRPQRFAPVSAVQVCFALLPAMGFAAFQTRLRWTSVPAPEGAFTFVCRPSRLASEANGWHAATGSSPAAFDPSKLFPRQ